jgi:hypothetical protein
VSGGPGFAADGVDSDGGATDGLVTDGADPDGEVADGDDADGAAADGEGADGAAGDPGCGDSEGEPADGEEGAGGADDVGPPEGAGVAADGAVALASSGGPLRARASSSRPRQNPAPTTTPAMRKPSTAAASAPHNTPRRPRRSRVSMRSATKRSSLRLACVSSSDDDVTSGAAPRRVRADKRGSEFAVGRAATLELSVAMAYFSVVGSPSDSHATVRS